MNDLDDDDITDGALAYREYPVVSADGSHGTIGFTLGNLDVRNDASGFAREHNALAFGVVSFSDVPGAPRHPLVWLHDLTDLCLASAEEDEDVSPELSELIVLYIEVFFSEMAVLSPLLAATRFGAGPSNDNVTMH